MSNYKPFHEQVATRLTDWLEAKITPFQKPLLGDETPSFQIPTNPSTGKNYRGLNALWLSMQPFADPRWMTLNQANKMNIKVPKGTSGTIITFIKTAESFPMLDEHGKKIKDEHGKTKYETIRLEKSIEETAWVFNAEQLGMPALVLEQNKPETGIERVQKLVEVAGINVTAHNKNMESYSLKNDRIWLPPQTIYSSSSQYHAAILNEIAHWSGHPDRLNREVKGRSGFSTYAAEELRAGLASLFLGAEIGIGMNQYSHYSRYIPEWIKLLKADPAEIKLAAVDAQKIFDYVLDSERKLGLKQDAQLKPAALGLELGDEMKYNNTTYRVNELMKGDKLKIEDLQSGAKIKITTTDGLYRSLVQAKYRGDELSAEVKNELSQDNGVAAAVSQEESKNKGIKR